MKLSLYSNAPWTPTGYGTQSQQFLRRVRDAGHEVAMLANYGLMGDTFEWEGIPIFPGGTSQYSLDVAPMQHKAWADGHPAAVIALYDVWVLGDRFDDCNVVGWTMVDSLPVPPDVALWCKDRRTIACSKFGHQALAETCVERNHDSGHVGINAEYIPLALDLTEWQPTESNVRRAMNVPDDAFLVMCNGYNYSAAQPRKGWFEMFAAFTFFAQTHPDAYLYLHTDPTRVGGADLAWWWKTVSLPEDKLRIANTLQYRAGAYKTPDMAALYTTADVFLATSLGEGFGLPVIEAQACGTSVIVNDWTAQPELVGAGWITKNQPTPYHTMKSLLATPIIGSIVEALEQAYESRGSADLKAKALAKAQEYDADTVFAEKWVPYLAQLEAEITPQRKVQNLAIRPKGKKGRKAA